MGRIKVEYIATVTIRTEREREPGMVSLEEMQSKMADGGFTDMLRSLIEDGIGMNVEVQQEYVSVEENG